MSIDSGHLVTFSNSFGDIVYLDGDLSLQLKAEDMNFVVGSSWAEHKAGTNAIGTALVTGSPIQVFAGEHFCHEVQKWTCSAAPIRDPATQHILGVIDLTGLWRVNHPHTLSAVMSTAQLAEKYLLNQLKQERFKLREYYSGLISSGVTTPFLVLDRGYKVIKATSMLYEQGWIDSNHYFAGAPSITFPLTSRKQWEVEHKKGIWRFELTPYIYGGNPIGAIVYAFPPNILHSLPVLIGETPQLSTIENGSESALASRDEEPFTAKQFMESDEFYKSLFEHNPSAVMYFDLKGNVLEANPAAERLLGHTVEELRKINIQSLILPEYAEKRLHHFTNVTRGKPQEFEIAVRHKNGHTVDISLNYFPMFVHNEIIGVYGIAKDITKHKQIEENCTRLHQEIINSRHVTSYETVRQRRDGSLLDASIFISPLSDTKGNVVAFVAILRDITERKRMEEALKENEKQLRTLINAMPDAVCFKDAEGRWIEANECCLRVFQLEDVPYQGKRDSELAAINPRYHAGLLQCEESDKLAWENGSTVRVEEVTPQPDGESRVFDVSKVPLYYPDGRRKGLVVISRDITEHKRTEELLRKSEKLSVVGQLAAGVAHEISNPLTSIRGLIQFLKEGNFKDEYFHTILSELDRIQFVVNEFLVLAKPQAINFKPRYLPFLLHQVVELLSTESIINNVQIAIEFEPSIPMVNCEGNQLKQVFIHILKNAIEAMPNGGQITVQLKRQQVIVLIRFIDQGDGITEERIQKLGEPFYTTKEKGTGLGLMISYKIVQAHQGSMKIKSEKHIGTTVEIKLPIV